jgi:hypothetical protein
MNINEQRAAFMINLMIAKIAELLAEKSAKTITDSMQDFMTTKTFSLLVNLNSFLYLESPEYILDMLEAEESGDMERWLEV